MARTIDLTGKLGLGERPRIVIGDAELEVDDRARTVMQVVSLMSGDITPEKTVEACARLFGEQGAAELDALGLTLPGFAAVLEAAMDLVMGGGDAGNGETPATT